MPDAKVVRTLYRELLRSGRIRVQQLARLNSAPLPELLERIPDKGPVSKWTNDEETLFDLTSTEKWIRVTLDVFGNDVQKAVRSRFDEQLDEAAKLEFESWVEESFADVDPKIRETMKEFVPDHFSHQVDNGFEALKLLDELNALVSVIEDKLPTATGQATAN